MIRSRRRPVTVPRITTQKSQTADFQYVRGWNSNTSNDDVPVDQLRLVVDARKVQLGKWDTRKGNDFFSVPIGEAINVQQTSTSGASNYSFSPTAWWAKQVVATATGPLTYLEANIRNTASATGTVVLALYTNNAGAPGTLLASSTIANSSVTASHQYLRARSITCPTVTNGTTYWVVGYVQEGGTNSYQISTTTNATSGLTSSNSGQTWSAANLDFNVRLGTATEGGVKGLKRVQRPNGSTSTFMAHGGTMYSINELDGVTTSVDAGLNSSASYFRSAFVNDTLYYVTGLQKPRKYDFTTASEVGAAPENASNIIEHKGLLFYVSAVDPTKVYFSNFAAYDTFTSTDFLYVPAPKTADPIVAVFKLNGVLYFQTRNNKYVLFGSENATFRLDNAIGQKGTYAQESIAYDEDSCYFANDEGIFRFNGAEEVNIAQDILNRWTELRDKDNSVLELANNRLYIWYTPNGGSENSRCFVYNTLYGVWESDDTLGYVQRTDVSDTDGYFLHGSNRCGMVMRAEAETNDYNSMGEPLSFELNDAYRHYGTPAQLKRVSNYRPHFDSVSGSYSVQAGYATDYSESPSYADVSLAGTGPRFNSGILFDDGATFGGTAQVNPMDSAPQIPGEWRRLQIRYKHTAAREPCSFDGHVLTVEQQRVM